MSKRILILGATKLSAEIAKSASHMGLYVIAIGNKVDNAIEQYCNEVIIEDISNLELVSQYIKILKINGLITGYIDSILPYYFSICQKFNFNSLLENRNILEATLNKIYFKKLCQKFSIPVIDSIQTTKNLIFPVIVKPSDASGARGISICNNDNDLFLAVKNAYSLSKSKKYLIEKYIELPEATVFYYIADGKPFLVGMADRHVYCVKKGFIKLPTGYSFPSKGLRKFIEESDNKFHNFFRHLNVKNGYVFIQGFLNDNMQFIPYECGFRLTPSFENYIIKYFHDFDIIENLIEFSMSGYLKPASHKHNLSFLPETSYNLSCLMRPGKIANIVGLSELSKCRNILYSHSSYSQGFELLENNWGELSQICLRFIFYANKNTYDSVINCIKDNIFVLDSSNNDLLINKEILM